MDPSVLPSLRPLNIGEIFDRAITLYVKNFAIFTLIVMTLLVPVGVAQYLVTPDKTATLQRVFDAMQHPGPAQAAKTPFPAPDIAEFGGIVVVAFATLALAPFANNAVAIGVAALYAGRRPDYRSSFGASLRRWPQILLLLLLWAAIFLGAYVVVVIAMVLLIALGTLAAHGAVALAVVIWAIVVVLAVALLLLAMVAAIAASFSFYAVAIEKASAVEALRTSLERVFNRKEIGKAILMALAYVALEAGILMTSATIGILLLYLLHSAAAQIGVATIFNSVLTAFLTILMAVYYYDVRIRREGFDLEADLQRLTAP